MFRFTKKTSSGSHSQCLAKITRRDRRCADVVSAMAVQNDLRGVCVVQCASVCLSLLLILTKHWLWLSDDGFFVNRNMLEQPLQF